MPRTPVFVTKADFKSGSSKFSDLYLFSVHQFCSSSCNGTDHARYFISAHGGQVSRYENEVKGFVVPDNVELYFYSKEGNSTYASMRDFGYLGQEDPAEIYVGGESVTNYKLSKMNKSAKGNEYSNRYGYNYSDLEKFLTEQSPDESIFLMDFVTIRNRNMMSGSTLLSDAVNALSKRAKSGVKIAIHCHFCRSGSQPAYDLDSAAKALQRAKDVVEDRNFLKERRSNANKNTYIYNRKPKGPKGIPSDLVFNKSSDAIDDMTNKISGYIAEQLASMPSLDALQEKADQLSNTADLFRRTPPSNKDLV